MGNCIEFYWFMEWHRVYTHVFYLLVKFFSVSLNYDKFICAFTSTSVHLIPLRHAIGYFKRSCISFRLFHLIIEAFFSILSLLNLNIELVHNILIVSNSIVFPALRFYCSHSWYSYRIFYILAWYTIWLIYNGFYVLSVV